ncbi:hypothetical protein QQ045_003016 [Rhodiola kirilowii]
MWDLVGEGFKFMENVGFSDVHKSPNSICFAIAVDEIWSDNVRAHAIEICPGVVKIVVRGDESVVDLLLDELELDLWRLPCRNVRATTISYLPPSSVVDQVGETNQTLRHSPPLLAALTTSPSSSPAPTHAAAMEFSALTISTPTMIHG